jgi:hypothetical protein
VPEYPSAFEARDEIERESADELLHASVIEHQECFGEARVEKQESVLVRTGETPVPLPLNPQWTGFTIERW